MGNFALQTSPCSFLKLRISPWDVLIPFLLYSSSLSALSLPWRLLSSFSTKRCSFSLSPSLCCSGPARGRGSSSGWRALAWRAGVRRRGGGAPAERVGASERRTARLGHGSCGSKQATAQAGGSGASGSRRPGRAQAQLRRSGSGACMQASVRLDQVQAAERWRAAREHGQVEARGSTGWTRRQVLARADGGVRDTCKCGRCGTRAEASSPERAVARGVAQARG
jgi:hypothetical protein